MSLLNEEIKSIEAFECPPGLHSRIMKKLMFLQFRTPFLIVVSLLVLNLVFTSWHMWIGMAEVDGYSVIKSLLAEFEWNIDYIGSFFTIIREFISATSAVSFILEILAIIYVFYLSSHLRKMQSPQTK